MLSLLTGAAVNCLLILAGTLIGCLLNRKTLQKIGERIFEAFGPVSYTHLDVYKRQVYLC